MFKQVLRRLGLLCLLLIAFLFAVRGLGQISHLSPQPRPDIKPVWQP
jgi:hypothetical protein